MKISSKRVASIAGKYLNLLDDDHLIVATDVEGKLFKMRGRDIRALAASVLAQAEPRVPLGTTKQQERRLTAIRLCTIVDQSFGTHCEHIRYLLALVEELREKFAALQAKKK